MLKEMIGFLLLCLCLLFGLSSYFGFRVWQCFGLPKKLQSLKEAAQGEDNSASSASERQDGSEASATEGLDDSEASASNYQVFLSFRGPDTRQGLADVLYSDMTTAGIRVFRDDDELEVGDEISKILPAIESSKICVPIFSKNFAASAWCLREVKAMVELKKQIVPIFYTATTEDVKLKTGLFVKDLKYHEKKYGREQVKQWEDALKAVAKIKGREVKSTGYAEFSKLFVRALLIKIKVKLKYVTDFLVKRDDQEEALMNCLDIGADDVRLIGIHGLGGGGKTTLAKVAFNQLSTRFDCCSFFENVQEYSRRNGLAYLQKQLLEDLEPKLKHFQDTDPNMLLRKKFRSRKVLIVLDDVNERKQVQMIVGALDWFGSGSRIMITTRDRRVFTKEVRTFAVQEMNKEEALELFSRHAFGADSPPSDYQLLSREVISLTGRLPLALEVIGSLCHGCEKKRWKVIIEKLEKVPNRNVQEKLRISFDVLEYEEKQIFLDIACFFVNKETSNAMYMWEAGGLFPDEGIEVLVSMSLLKIEKNEFLMHDLIRELGRGLVREECAGEAAKRSRIWSQTEALEVLKIKKGKKKVEGLCLEEVYEGNLTNEEFSSFKRLRFLKLVGTKLDGDLEHLLPKLRWFSWHRSPLDFTATNLSLGKLVVLDLSRSAISESWAGWSLIQMAKNLKVLDLTECRNLRSTPDLSNNEALERLVLRGCYNLSIIHSSIGKLKRLKHLNLEGCSALRGLPEELGSLENLEEIFVKGDGDTFHIPESIGKLDSLSIIKLHRVEITRIPQSIRGLVNLTCLALRNCTGLQKLPDELGDLKSLIELDLSETEVCVLPNSVGRLVKLKTLNMESTKIDELPDSLGALKSLTQLCLGSSQLRILPDCVGDLESLTYLNLSSTRIEELPDWVGDLSELDTLQLNSSSISKLPSTLGKLKKLRWLGAADCNLTEVAREMGTISRITSLQLLRIGFQLHESGSAGAASLTTSLDLGTLTLLHTFNLDCSGLTRIPQLPAKVRHLILINVRAEAKLPDFSNLVDLQSVKFRNCSIKDVDELKGLRELRRLGAMGVSGCSKELIEFSCQLKNLRSLNISGSSEKVLDFSLLRNLRYFELENCNELVGIRGVGNLKGLERIIFNCCTLIDVHELQSLREELQMLKYMEVIDCSEKLVELSCRLENLTELVVSGSFEKLLDFSLLRNLCSLELKDCRELVEIHGLGKLESLEELKISDCDLLESVGNLSELKKLQTIIMTNCPKFKEIEERDADGDTSADYP